jgi:hypothetical protein
MQLLKDERGVSTVSYAVILPFFLLLLFGGYYVWQIVAVKQALNHATYMAARAISRSPRVDVRYQAPQILGPMMYEMARASILEALRDQEGFVSREFSRRGITNIAPYLTVIVNLEPTNGQPVERQGQTSILFEVYARLDLPWMIRPPFLPARSLSPSASHIGSFIPGDYLDLYGTRQLDPEKPIKAADPEAKPWRVSP